MATDFDIFYVVSVIGSVNYATLFHCVQLTSVTSCGALSVSWRLQRFGSG